MVSVVLEKRHQRRFLEFYNESDEVLTKDSVAVCFGCVCFKDQSPAIPKLSVRASKLSPCPGNPLLDSYVDTLHPMMNAFLDFVGVVNRQLPRRDDHRFVCLHDGLRGKDGGDFDI